MKKQFVKDATRLVLNRETVRYLGTYEATDGPGDNSKQQGATCDTNCGGK